MKRTITLWQVSLLALALAAAQGCYQPTAAPIETTQPPVERIENRTQTEPPARAPAPENPPAVVAAADGRLVEEVWEACTIQGSPAGYTHTTVTEVEENGQTLVRTQALSHVVINRAGQTVTQEMAQTGWDTKDGQFVRFETRMTAGTGQLVTTGKVGEGELEITVQTLGKSQTQSIPWKREWGGPFATEQSLRKQPLAAGEKRTVRGFVPMLNIAGDTVLEAGGEESVTLPSGDQKLMRVSALIDLGVQKLETVLWVNERGEALKSLVPAITQENVRTTKEIALKTPAGGAQLDLLAASVVKLKGNLTKSPHTTKKVVYRAHVTSGKIEGVFADCLSQRVKPIDEQSAELTVAAVRPTNPAALDVVPKMPDEADSAPNNLIQSDDPEIVKMAAAAAPEGLDDWRTATTLEGYVAKTIKKKNFSQAFGTAAEVVRSLEGDCTEHAVLLAALCRARKIPARVAFGVVYYPPQKGFAYHMWNEVWIADRWVPLDGTMGLGGIGADHVKLADSNLAGASAYSAMLPVVQVFGRLELDVLSAE